MARSVPSYHGRVPASPRASAAARGASAKTNTRPEIELRRFLWRAGCRYRKDVRSLPGRPDIVFTGRRVVVFCDGDFWHGRDWDERREKLRAGANAEYWVAKIGRNIERDRKQEALLRESGWVVLRFWESEILSNTAGVAGHILAALRRAG